MKIPLCKITPKSKWKNGPIQVGVVDKLPMKGISLILGNEVKIKKGQPSRMVKMSAKNEEDKMATEPRARYHLRSPSQSGKVERKEMKMPHHETDHQRKDENLEKRYDQIRKNDGNKFPNTYLEDKRTVRGPLQMAKKRQFKMCEEVLLLSPNRGFQALL